MKRRGFLASLVSLAAAGLYGAAHSTKTWLIARVDRESRSVTFEEVNKELKRIYPKDVFFRACERESTLRKLLRG